MTSEVVLADGELVRGAPAIHVRVHEERISFGERDLDGSRREERAEVELTVQAVVAGDLVQRFRARRPALPGLEVCRERLGPRAVEPLEHAPALQARAERLLVPTVHRGAARVPIERAYEVTGVPVALCEVERAARVGRVRGERLEQQTAVPLVLVGGTASGTEPARI